MRLIPMIGCTLFFGFFSSAWNGEAPPPSSSAAVPPALILDEESQAKEPYIFELIEHDARFEADGKGQQDFLFRARVQSESAVRDFGLLVYPYASNSESLDVVYVRVRKADGTVIETPPGDIQELDSAVSREAPMYTDQREKHIAVKSLTVGDIVEGHIRWTTREPLAPNHFWFDYSYFRSGICLREVVQIDVPVNVLVKIRNSEPQPVVREAMGRRIYTFESANLKRPEVSKIPDWEKNSKGNPPPDFQITSFASWAEVGKWYDSLVQPRIDVTPEIQAKSDELTKGKNTVDEKLHALYDFVSIRIRYIGIDLGQGRYTPHSASDVLNNRYGDCKDKHTLFASLLKAAGIDSFPVLISSKYQIDPSFPTMSLFDHVITAIPQRNSFLFLDTTPEVAPYGLLMPNLRDRQSLVMPMSSAAHLVSTPLEPPFPAFERFRIESSIDTHGTLDGKAHLEERGDGEVALRSAYRSTPENRWEELTQNLVARLGFGGTVSQVSASRPEDTTQPFWISWNYHRTEYPDWNEHRITLPSPPIFLAMLNEEQKLSKEPLPLGTLSDITYEAVVKFPPGFHAIPLENVERATDFANFSAVYSTHDETINGTVHLKTIVHELAGAQRAQFSSFAKTVDDTMRRYVGIAETLPSTDRASLLTLGRNATVAPDSAIPTLEKTLAENPDNRIAILSLSEVYCRAGRAKDAIPILEQALAKNPENPIPFDFALGHAYLGVHDTDKAAAFYKKALGEDPEIRQLNYVASDLLEENVLLDEALAYSNRAVSACASRTMGVAPKDVGNSEFALMPELAVAWGNLGWSKFRTGDATGGEKYLEAAWQLMQTSAIGEHLVEVYESLGNLQKAASVCNMAQASLDYSAYGSAPALREKLEAEMKRLRPFLKPKPSALGNSGHYIPDGHVALSDMRSLDIPFSAKLQNDGARADLFLSITNGSKVEEVIFRSGPEVLRKTAASMVDTKFPQSFPDDTPTRVLRKANLNCSRYSKTCMLAISTVQDAAVPTRILKVQ